jgi:hypothetical protein
MAGRAALALRENWCNTDTFVVARIMLECIPDRSRSCLGMARVEDAAGEG